MTRHPMIVRRLAVVFLALLGAVQAASAKECLLSHATYREPRSGAVMQFRPLNNEPAALAAEVFSVTVPNTEKAAPKSGSNKWLIVRHASDKFDRL
ncbi:hypothetical protein [Mesorhizobium sp. M0847]|uniref:hypothetical protein n=1 Tax=unclassified Mesorhizobium TaxID=325217 RepID=UPI0033358D68